MDAFNTCPKRYHQVNILKKFREGPSEHLEYGKKVHAALEKYVMNGTELPIDLAYMANFPIVERLRQAPGEKLAEQQLAINDQFMPTGWFDKDVFCRSIIDIAVLGEEEAMIGDWKTGKVKDGDMQLKLMALVLMLHRPRIKRVTAGFIWLKEKGLVTKVIVDADKALEVWNEILPQVSRLQQAFIEQEFPPKPSGLCRKFCPVTSCPHHGEGG